MATSNLEGKFGLQASRLKVITLLSEQAKNGDFDEYCLDALTEREEFLDGHLSKFEALHEKLCEAKVEGLTDHAYFTTDSYLRILEVYSSAKSRLTSLKQRQRQKEEDASPRPADRLARSSLMTASGGVRRSLPKIQLPSFAGSYTEWRPFADLFSTLVGDCSDLEPVEKMFYLKASLTGEASRFISSIPVSGDAFAAAWDTLTRRYENRRLLISAQVERLVNGTPLPPKSSQAVNGLLSEAKEALDALKGLHVPVEHWDVILVHLLVRRLDPLTREAWENHLGQKEEHPTWKDLQAFLTGRARARETLELSREEVSSSRPPATSGRPSVSSRPPPSAPRVTARPPPASAGRAYHAAELPPNYKDGLCDMCGKKHYITECAEFLALPIIERRRIAVQHRLCYNCLGRHSALNCRSERRCRTCGNKHHTLIHFPAHPMDDRPKDSGWPGIPSGTPVPAAPRATAHHVAVPHPSADTSGRDSSLEEAGAPPDQPGTHPDTASLPQSE
uniref:uncharacterized protein LOC117611030 n=1 Tax=Osmia lignaria TaxID=473952 RepID=UPI0014787090|nr:uncharacterized protein LOC117611030 [Osmia lignaria]